MTKALWHKETMHARRKMDAAVCCRRMEPNAKAVSEVHHRFCQWGLLAILLIASNESSGAVEAYLPSGIDPPGLPREFRGVWVASVGNLHWPSKPGLSTGEQKAELLRIFDRAVQVRLNTIILQVRPSCDALYPSRFEPWSEYLTGTMGRAPSPFYDPLAFAVEEAHRRGLELHAWFNPFRARHTSAASAVSKDHVSRKYPLLVRKYGSLLWLDPGEPAAIEHTLKVVVDVVRRYDVDGIHLDDYFYPYPEKDGSGRLLPFPDWPSWRRYQAGGGKLSRDDWRRENVNGFVRRLYQAVKAEKQQVKVGISPFGIWRPGYPAEIRGFDAYAGLYADPRQWLQKGWMDYISPQLYWPADQREQSYPRLLAWWAEQNIRGRHLWPGLQMGNGYDEIMRQIGLTRQNPGSSGHILWGVRLSPASANDRLTALGNSAYASPALVPATKWLDGTAPSPPLLSISPTSPAVSRVQWKPGAAERVWLWVLQSRREGRWKTEILPGPTRGMEWGAALAPEVIALTAIDRCGNASAPAVLERKSNAETAAPER